MTIKRTWAEGAVAGDVTEPPVGVRFSGYQFEDGLPHDEFNKIVQDLYRLAANGGAYDGLPALLEPDVPTDRDVLLHKPVVGPFRAEWAYSLSELTGENVRNIATNGRHVIVSADKTWKVFDFGAGYDSATDRHVDALPASTTAITAVAVGHTSYALIYNDAGGTNFRAFDLQTDAILGDFFHSASGVVATMCCYGTGYDTYVFGGTPSSIDGATTRHLYMDGAVIWSMDRGASCAGVTTDGSRIFSGGPDGTSSANIEELDPTTGAVLRFQNSAAPDGAMTTDGTTIYFTSGGTDLYSTSCNLFFSATDRQFPLTAGSKSMFLCSDLFLISEFGANRVSWYRRSAFGTTGEFGIFDDLPHVAPVGVVVVDDHAIWAQQNPANGLKVYRLDGRHRRIRKAEGGQAFGLYRCGPISLFNYV